MTPALLRDAALVLALPGLGLAWLAARHGDAHAATIAAIALGLLPIAVLPLLHRACRGPAGQARLLRDLGAGPAARWRLLWLPVFVLPLAAGLSAAALWLLLAGLAPPLGGTIAGPVARHLHPGPSGPL